MRLANRKLLVISILVLILIIAAIAEIHEPAKNVPNGETGQYMDPLSHETVSSPTGKTPDTYGQNANSLLYLGFDKLLNHGLTFKQLNNLKSAFGNYSSKQSPQIKEVTIDVDHITSQYNPSSGDDNFYILFSGLFDRKTAYRAKIQYSNITDIRLFLLDVAGNQLFDSGVVKSGE
jgi:hypothetical protein